ncbi:uncharacterized protein EI97DRAFT_440735 [Westerdykella ornata]|uniref:Uncharacterized protein n=1 Tax=Westerdykella ornata TaxID=318751 RepID=A0A6A6JPA5_WESOR|nr:uncharacterized protein EI97DRAFT_440735 [Westerdykella ornata]KAF2278227.1 hypothetical protein EI97DRAFT_440735 [Westerdykella ornata]
MDGGLNLFYCPRLTMSRTRADRKTPFLSHHQRFHTGSVNQLAQLLRATPIAMDSILRIVDRLINRICPEVEEYVLASDYAFLASLTATTLFVTGTWYNAICTLIAVLVEPSTTYPIGSEGMIASLCLIASLCMILLLQLMIFWEARRLVKIDLEVERAINALILGPQLPLNEDMAYKEISDMRVDQFDVVDVVGQGRGVVLL